ncbi:MAG: glycosyltransferase family 39 protein [Planctomycetota bacterium]
MQQVGRRRSAGVLGSDADPAATWVPSPVLVGAVVVLLTVASLAATFGGPDLGDHEAMVAQCARDMRLTGDWIIPQFLDTPLVRKPPLPYWLVAIASYLFPNDPRTGLPVTPMVARLPSALGAFGTALLLWRLASAMFGRRAGVVAAVLAGSSVYFMLYSANATVEMLLTFCCTWAYLHFWYALTVPSPGWRRLHLLLFYVALGVAMLAKGPAPIALVALPLVFWWYAERPLRMLARRGPGGWRQASVCAFRQLWTRTAKALTELWLVPGLIVFALVFVPWMWAVASRQEQAWNLWNWQYLQRAEGDYEDTRVRGPLYYLPLVIGYLVPWCFLIFEGLAAPWLKPYAGRRRALFFVGTWGVIGIVVMSAMAFKKPYYVGPAVPGLILLMTVVAERFYSRRPQAVWGAWLGWGATAAGLVVFVIFGHAWLREKTPAVAAGLTGIGTGALLLLLTAGVLYIRGRGWLALGLTALTSVATFQTVWYGCGRVLDNADKVAALAQALDEAGVAREATVLWADQRPDARLGFYFNRRTGHMVKPFEIVARITDRTRGKDRLTRMALEKAKTRLESVEPVYLILDRKNYERWGPEVLAGGHLVASIAGDPRTPGEDWVIVSNADK